MRTLDQFITENKIRANVEEVAPDGNWHARDLGGRSFSVTLHMERRRLTVPFHQGSGIQQDPTVADVLGCLAMDASGYENAGKDFGEWAAEYGYEDVQDAWKTWRAVERQSAGLARLLNAGPYRDLMENTHHDPSESDDEDESER